jgi:hypothetical protein
MTRLRCPSAAPIEEDGWSSPLFDLCPTPMWVQEDETFRLLMVNDSALRLHGAAGSAFWR